MKILIAAVVLVILGLAGTVVFLEGSKPSTANDPIVRDLRVIDTLTGDAARNIAANIPTKGFVVVEFTGDF